MKTNFTSFPQKNLRLLAIALFSLLLVNCSKNDDDDAPESFEFEEFENLSELPDIEDADPEFTDPDLGAVNESEAIKAMIADFQNASGELSETTKSNLTAVGNFSDGLTTNVDALVAELDAAKIEELLSATELTGDYAALAAELNDLPASVAGLFPSITLSDDYKLAQNKAGVVINDLLADLQAQSGTGPCFDAAKAAYDKALEAPIAKRDIQVATFTTNYSLRLTAVDTRYNDRIDFLSNLRSSYFEQIGLNANAILDYAALADEDLQAQLRTFALFYVVKSYTVVNTFEEDATNLIEDRKAEETQTVETIKDDKTALAESNFAAVKAEADALLTAAYNKCHNQGSGN